MKFKKAICSVLLLATVCATKVFATGEDPRVGQLREYMKGVCAKVISPENTNPYVEWAKKHVPPTELPMTIYQLWASGGYNCTKRNDDSRLSPALIEQFKIDAMKEVCSLGYTWLEIFTALNDMLKRPEYSWMVDWRDGMAIWSHTILNEFELINKKLPINYFRSKLKNIENRSDFFGNCLFGAIIAANKCEELGLPWSIEILNNHHFDCTFYVNGKKYIVHYILGVRQLAHGQPSDDVVQPFEQYAKYVPRTSQITLSDSDPLSLSSNPGFAPILLDALVPIEETLI